MAKKKILAFLMVLVFSLQFNSIAHAQPVLYGVDYAPSIYYNMSFKDIGNSFASYDIMKMAALSVIRGGGLQKFYPKAYLKKEEALTYIIRLMGLEDQLVQTNTSSSTGVAGGVPATSLSKFKVDDWAKGVIDLALKANLITKEEIDTDFTSNATREEVAYWLAKGLGLNPASGLDLQKVYNFKDVRDITFSYLPYVGALVNKGVISGYSDGNFRPKAYITREQMASILNRAFDYSYSNMGYSVLNGTIRDISYKNLLGQGIWEKTFTVSSLKGEEYLIVTKGKPSISLHGKRVLDFLTIDNNTPAYSSVFNVGDEVRFYVKGGNVIFAEKLPHAETIIYGEIADITSSTIALKGTYNDTQIFHYTPLTEVFINEYPATIKDLKVGQMILAYLERDTAYRIEVNYEEYSSSGIETGSRQVTGSIISIKPAEGDLRKGGLNISLNDGNVYYISPNTPLVKGGVSVPLSSLKVGDYVNLIFDDPYTDTPLKVLISNGYYDITGVLRGTLSSVIPLGKVINLTNVEKYYQGTWQKVSDYVSYPFEKAEFYLNGLKIEEKTLKNYYGKTIYITTENHFGKEYVTFGNLVSPFTMSYQGKADFDPYSMTLTLGDGRKVAVNDGTIIIKEGKRVPFNILSSNQVYVSFSRGDNLYANFVSVMDTYDVTPYYYAKGNLFYATANSVSIGNVNYPYYSYTTRGYYEILNNQWKFVSGSKVVYVGDSTFVVDNREKTSKVIPYNELLNIRYGSSPFKDAFAYVVAYRDNAIAINIMPSTSGERITTAKIESVDNDRITISEVKDWNEVEGTWNLNTDLEVIDLSKAIIVKEGRSIDISSLKKGDLIYMVRSASKGIIVTVE